MRTQAIILKKIPVQEHDQLVVCYTRDVGKQTYRAKSVMKSHSKQASHLDVLNWADFHLVSSVGYPIIASAGSVRTFHALRSHLPPLAAAHFLLDCFDKLVFEGQYDEKLWNFLTSELIAYNARATEEQAPWSYLIEKSKRRLLETLGYDTVSSLEQISGNRLHSLLFVQKVLG